MEPDVGVSLVKNIEEKGVSVTTLIMDDDASTVAKIRQNTDHEVTKWSDTNHTLKHLTNSLYTLQKKHKILNTQVIRYLKKCFSYAVAQNKGEVEECKNAISSIVPHAFGDHLTCGNWCGFNNNPETYRHSGLAKDLEGDILKEDLTAVFGSFAGNAAKIAPGGSTREVESFNNMIGAKAPKRCHFSATGGLKSRVDCAVLQKNLGNSYVSQVNESIGLSPGRISMEVGQKRDTERKRQLEYTNRRDVKRRRLQLKFEKENLRHAKETREGVTYKTAMATSSVTDITEIPPPVTLPQLETIPDERKFAKVFCDIETSSLQKNADILQIAAVCEDDKFSVYITPTKSVSPGASAVTGLTAQGGVLFHNGTPVPTVPLKQALQSFLGYLADRAPVVLIGHNFKSFDFPRIITAMHDCELSSAFREEVIGGVDTLPLMKEKYPNRAIYKQEELVSDILNETYEAHNAMSDVTSLQKLYAASDCDSLLEKYSFTTSWGLDIHRYHLEAEKRIGSLQVLVDGKTLSKTMAMKIAGSGLKFDHLKLAFQRGGYDGIRSLLSEKVNGTFRVTNSVKVAKCLATFFE